MLIELIQLYQAEAQAPSKMICLENKMQIEPILPSACRLVMLHFIVIQGMVHNLPDIHARDVETGQEFVIKDTLQIYVQ